MLIAKNDEEKRSKLWRITMTVSTLVIIAVAFYFIIRMFTANPIEGTWVREESDVVLVLGKDGQAEIKGGDLFADAGMSVKLTYTIDKTDKLITIKLDEESYMQMAEKADEANTVSELEALLKDYVKTFNYNLEQQQLTLSEREYGSRLIFDKN